MRTGSSGGSYDDMFGDGTEHGERERDDHVDERDGFETTTGVGTAAVSPGQGNAPQMTRNGTHSAVVTAIDNLLNVATRSMEEEIKWQLGKEIAQQTELTVFMFLRPNSPGRTVSLVHSDIGAMVS